MNELYQHDALPVDDEGVIAFLASPWVEGIGTAYAHRLVEMFGTDAVRILMDEPQKAENIHGLGLSRIKTASESINALKYPVDLLLFLFSCRLNDSYIHKILGKYRSKSRERILTDPYDMVENVWRLSFHTADKIGRRLNIHADDPRRLRGALLTAIKHYADNGHLYATPEEALATASKISGVEIEKIKPQIESLIENGRIIRSRGGLYLPVFYNAEKNAARKLTDLSMPAVCETSPAEIPQTDGEGHKYSDIQRDAILKILNSPVMVLTGGPGSGKTTVLKGVIDVLQNQGKKVVLAAPTGRAAKRMSMLTGMEAYTIHRLLGYREGQGWSHRPIDADVLIIDEGSMMEQVLFDHLLESVRPGTRIIMVGDVDQLPAIGAGDVLRDMIDSDLVPVARLSENFRQSDGSMISAGANSIVSGNIPHSNPESDFIIIPEPSVKAIHNRIISLISHELPDIFHIPSSEIQVVTPQQIGALGARQLNKDLQEILNPTGPSLKRGETIMRLGDPVMQTSNSSQRKIYNGEVGHITAVDENQQRLTVTFADERISEYSRGELSELTLAYATTVHKLQGSEVKYMIFPVTMAHKPMLYRNLLYTAVSRARRLCVLVGEEDALQYAIDNNPFTKRNSNFRQRLDDR